MVPERDMKTPLVMSATNPLGIHRVPSGSRRTVNFDLASDLSGNEGPGGIKTANPTKAPLGLGSKPRIPLPKRGNSLGLGRMKTSS